MSDKFYILFTVNEINNFTIYYKSDSPDPQNFQSSVRSILCGKLNDKTIKTMDFFPLKCFNELNYRSGINSILSYLAFLHRDMSDKTLKYGSLIEVSRMKLMYALSSKKIAIGYFEFKSPVIDLGDISVLDFSISSGKFEKIVLYDRENFDIIECDMPLSNFRSTTGLIKMNHRQSQIKSLID